MAVLALLAALLAGRPPPGSNSALVAFAPGSRPSTGTNAARHSSLPILWIDPKGRMMIVALDPPQAIRAFYAHGAMLVTRSPILAGCASDGGRVRSRLNR